MNLIKPKKLKKGDTITIIATSGNVNIEKIKEGVKYFHEKGFNVKLGKNIEKTDKYMAGSDIERLEDLHNAFADEEVNAIICARGGYGAIRLIDKIDYSIIQNNQIDTSIDVIKDINLISCGHNHGGLVPTFLQDIIKGHRGFVGPYLKLFQANAYKQ